jgi:Tol biopolymer transport system component
VAVCRSICTCSDWEKKASRYLFGGGRVLWLAELQSPYHRDTDLPVVSPDGKWIVCLLHEEGGNKTKIAIVSFTDGRIMRKFDVPPGLCDWSRLSWMPDGKAIAYIADRGGVSNIFAQPIDGSEPGQITKFSSGLLFSFAWSRDGTQLACARGGITSDVVLIHDLR